SAGPALAITAVFASKALMPRKSRRAAPGTMSAVHVMPPSTMRKTRPALQPAHATSALTAETLRQLDVDGTDWRCHRAGPPASGPDVGRPDRVAPEHVATETTESTAMSVAHRMGAVMRYILRPPCKSRRCRTVR